jgi:hypothetical protein
MEVCIRLVQIIYTCIKKILPSSTLGIESIAVVAQVWGSWAPSKVIVFSWQALLGRLPIRDNLACRHILPSSTASWCPWCPLAWAVWALVHRWFGVLSVVSSTLFSMCESFLKGCRIGKQRFKGVLLVWHAIIWTLWRAMNDKIFSAKEVWCRSFIW